MKVLLIFSLSFTCGFAARILGVIPTASLSHHLPFIPVWKGLLLRGHQVTLLTTNPINDPALKNLTEIDLSYSYEISKKYNLIDVASDESKSSMDMIEVLGKLFNETFHYQLSHPQVQKLLEDKNIKFDVALIESQLPIPLAFGWRFNCPVIGITSMEAPPFFHSGVGNMNHPLISPNPNLVLEDQEHLTFKDRLRSVIYNLVYEILMKYRMVPRHTTLIRQYFGNDAPSVAELIQNISMLMVATNPIFQNPRAVNPNTIFIGNGLHIGAPQDLPKNLQKYLDNSKKGAIYFSLGSNVKGRLLNDTTKREILNAFADLPYNVLMKMDTELKDVPKNVRIEKWLPQQDILRHPNVKLFISQGGLQSLQESITNGIPLVGIPFFGDQISNVYRMVKKGYGVRLDKKEITKDNLKAAILEVMNNPKYREKAKEMGELLHDEPMTSLEKAVWWIEYVIRHKGAKHLRSPAVDLPVYQYYMLDVIGFLLLVTIIPIYLFVKILKFIVRKMCCKKSKSKRD